MYLRLALNSLSSCLHSPSAGTKVSAPYQALLILLATPPLTWLCQNRTHVYLILCHLRHRKEIFSTEGGEPWIRAMPCSAFWKTEENFKDTPILVLSTYASCHISSGTECSVWFKHNLKSNKVHRETICSPHYLISLPGITDTHLKTDDHFFSMHLCSSHHFFWPSAADWAIKTSISINAMQCPMYTVHCSTVPRT